MAGAVRQMRRTRAQEVLPKRTWKYLMTMKYMWEGPELSHGPLALFKPPSEVLLSSRASVTCRHLTATCAFNYLPYTNESQISPASLLEFQKHRVKRTAWNVFLAGLDSRCLKSTPTLVLPEAWQMTPPLCQKLMSHCWKIWWVSIALRMNEQNPQCGPDCALTPFLLFGLHKPNIHSAVSLTIPQEHLSWHP